jgi:serine/threonine-protein kinase
LLRAVRQREVSLPVEIAVRVLLDALAGLHAAHELRGADGALLNLVHRDMSPQNVLVGVDGISRITDFGIALAASCSTVLPERTLLGKLSYMAPEQLIGLPATRRIDIFAAGAVLWEALVGRALFRRDNDAATSNAILHDAVPPPSSIVPGVPAALDAVVLKALDKRPDSRYQTAAEFADALEQVPIEPATTRAVAAYVEDLLGQAISERRLVIRDASGQIDRASQEPHSDGSSKVFTASGERSIPALPGESAGTSRLRRDDAEAPPASTTAVVTEADIEHRRMRSLLAAAMLLLVGSAVGLLLARSSGQHAAPPAPSATSSAHGVQSPQALTP